MKKILAMLLCVIMVVSMAAMVSADEATATQVTDSVAVGDQIVLGNIGGTHAMGAQDGKKRTAVAATAAGGVLTLTAETVVLTVEAGTAEGSFALKAADGYLFYDAEAGGNAMHTKAELDAAASWTITITDGVAAICNVATPERFLQYNFNTNQERFVCYKGTQENVVIYKLGAGVVPPVTEPSETEPSETEPAATEPAVPSYTLETVTEPAADTAYKFGLYQTKAGKQLFVDGTIASERYLGMTEDPTAAVDVYAEAVEGGYKFYILVDGVKCYITVYNNDAGKLSVKYDPAGTSVFVYNAECKNWVTKMEDQDYYLGTYNTFETLSASKVSYITAENTGVDQFPANLYTVTVEKNDGTGDMIGVVLALLTVSGMGIAVLKKEK